MPNTTNKVSFIQSKGQETQTSQKTNGRLIRNLNFNTTMITDDILGGTTTTKNINGNSLPQNSTKPFRRIFR